MREQLKNFNPRSHCRERPWVSLVLAGAYTFQSTFPLQGTTNLTEQGKMLKEFQSTFPLQGTTCFQRQMRTGIQFQSTFPLQGTTLYAAIHGAGCWDFNPRSHCRERRAVNPHQKIHFIFQSTFPLQGTTANLSNF